MTSNSTPKDTSKGKREAAAARRVAAVQLRMAGASYRTIAQKLGVSHVQAFKDVRAALKTTRVELTETTEEMITLEYARLEAATLAIAERVMKGDLKAIDCWIRLSESRRRLLGLDAPNKIAPTTPDGLAPWQPFDPRKWAGKLTDEQLAQLEELLTLIELDGRSVPDEDPEEEEDEKYLGDAAPQSRWKGF